MLGSDGRERERENRTKKEKDKIRREGGIFCGKRKGKGKRQKKKRSQREAVQDHGEYMREGESRFRKRKLRGHRMRNVMAVTKNEERERSCVATDVKVRRRSQTYSPRKREQGGQRGRRRGLSTVRVRNAGRS